MRSRLFGSVVLAIVLGMSPNPAGPYASAQDVTAKVATAKDVAQSLRIGVGAPLSGIDAIFGSQILRGVREAVNDINVGGGFLGHKAVVVPGDDASDPKKGVDVAKGFVGAGTNLVIGHFSSAVTMPASAVYAEAKALDITPSAEAPQITDRGFPTVFRTCGRDDQQASVAARFLTDRHYVKIAILHDRSSVGKRLADAVRKLLADRGVTAAFYGGLGEGGRDVGPVVSRIKAAGSQIVFWGGGAQGATQLVRPLRDARITLIGGTGIASDDFATTAGNAADGTFIVFPQDPRKRPAAARILNRLKSRKIEPDGYFFYAYAAIQVISQAAEAARSLEPEAIAKVMHSSRAFQTVLGPISFDDKGDPKVSDFAVYVWHRGPSGRMEFLEPAAS